MKFRGAGFIRLHVLTVTEVMKPDGSIFGFASSWERTVKLRRNYNESAGGPLKMPICQYILCSVDRASLYNLVNKTNLVHNLFLVYLCTLHTRQSSTQNNKYQVSQKHSCFSRWWAHSRPKHVEIDKYTESKLRTRLVLFTRLYGDARSTKHKNHTLRFQILTAVLLRIQVS
jgi:hypothetical protein